ncbi:hypothetical protein J1605_010274 [Eschrichtius robustus]|uniref:Secreted protein n=1 Tax=Eschrichtius robustus TaxID=9764 RepID=A0AB34GUY1_ESCRO|nr:hypothetical protein J1605_010274 [Eschrichtius robustus]
MMNFLWRSLMYILISCLNSSTGPAVLEKWPPRQTTLTAQLALLSTPGSEEFECWMEMSRIWLKQNQLASILSMCTFTVRAGARMMMARLWMDQLHSPGKPLKMVLEWGGEASALFLSGHREMVGGAKTTAPVMATPTASTPSPSAAQPKAERSLGTWKSVRPRWPQPTAAESPMIRKSSLRI